MVRVCVVGCLHGKLDQVYEDIAALDAASGRTTELVLCCGDFQAVRNPADLQSMSVPAKFYELGDFYRYYSEEMAAPILTIFVGGNHEASNYLQELPYGGWVAPNIWYMGYAGVVQFKGLRIGGLSGIYKQHDYSLGHFERAPYSEATKRSVYHLRSLEVLRLGQVARRLDVVLSHDWPRGVYRFGDVPRLLSNKPLFRPEVEANALGSPPAEQLLCRLRPRYWFSAHLHCKFSAIVQHSTNPGRQTKFLALDKCLPNRDYLQALDIEPDPSPSAFDSDGNIVGGDGSEAPLIVSSPTAQSEQSVVDFDDGAPKLFVDPEWLCVLQSTNEFLSVSQTPSLLPGQDGKNVRSYSATAEELKAVYETFGGVFSLPHNFERTAPIYKPMDTSLKKHRLAELAASDARKQKKALYSNPQTELLCAMLEITNPNAALLGKESYNLSEMSSRIMAETDDDDAVESACSSGTEDHVPGPSPVKLARALPNPEEIDIDDIGDWEDRTLPEPTQYIVGVVESLTNDNEYNPKPVGRNPEVIDIPSLEPDKSEESAVEPIVYGSGYQNKSVNENEYNPEPVVRNPEVIDIDNLNASTEAEEDGRKLEIYGTSIGNSCADGDEYEPQFIKNSEVADVVVSKRTCEESKRGDSAVNYSLEPVKRSLRYEYGDEEPTTANQIEEYEPIVLPGSTFEGMAELSYNPAPVKNLEKPVEEDEAIHRL